MNFEESNMLIDCKFDEMLDNYDEGYAVGHAAGYEAGRGTGYTDGYESGKSEWYSKGFVEGESSGLERGRQEGYTEGYGVGLAEGVETGRAQGYEEGKTAGLAEGVETGRALGYTDGYEAGKSEWYIKGVSDGERSGRSETLNSWWNSITNNGARRTWNYAFSQMRLKKELFRPPCTMVLSGNASCVFYMSTVDIPIDAQALEEELGYPLFDTSNATRLDYFNQNGVFSTLGVIDLSKCTASNSATYIFATNLGVNYLRSIKKLRVSKDTDYTNRMFNYCSNLTHCVFEGTIGKTGLDMSACTKLDYESLVSIIECLSTTTSGLTVTVSREAVTNAFQEDTLLWTNTINTKPNWTINLV